MEDDKAVSIIIDLLKLYFLCFLFLKFNVACLIACRFVWSFIGVGGC